MTQLSESPPPLCHDCAKSRHSPLSQLLSSWRALLSSLACSPLHSPEFSAISNSVQLSCVHLSYSVHLSSVDSSEIMQSYESTASLITPEEWGRVHSHSNGGKEKKRWILNAFDMACAGHQSPGLWKHPQDRSASYHDIEYWTDLAKTLERGKFNGIFIADVLGPYDIYGGDADAAARTGAQWGVDDPTLVISAAAAVTKNLSFGITSSITYESPYTLARRYGTLDHLTKGRVAFNIVTSYLDSAARNFGLDRQMEHDERYERGDEYLDVLYKLLLSSWSRDAVTLSVHSDQYANPSRIRPINHEGKYFKVAGPGITEPSPQGFPLIYQAGSSNRGLAFGAKHAECVFMSGPSAAKLRIQVDALRSAAKERGRDPQSIKVLIKLLVIVDATDELAQAKADEYRRLASREGAKVLFGGWIGEDLSKYEPGADLREVGAPSVKAIARGYAALHPQEKGPWTADLLADHIKLGGMGPLVVGGPETVADKLEEWIEGADADGFNLCYAITPGTFEDIVDHLVPELQKRGVHWKDYPVPEGGKLSAREAIYGVGQRELREDHYASKFKWGAGEEPPVLE